MIRFGQRITLTTGETPVLRDVHNFSKGLKAFVEHDQPVPWGVNGKVIGHATRVWVEATGYIAAHDRDGCKIGMIYQPDRDAA
jgi:hypothetical protein